MGESKILRIKNLVKYYGSVKAVNNISFDVVKGTCFGILGPNGAGKTTTLEIIEGITKETSGEILYKDNKLSAQFRQEVGILFQSTSLQEHLTCRETLEMFATFYDKTLPIEKLVKMCSLEEFIDRDSGKLSGGQRQRLLFAIAMVNDPDIIFLDEPTTGLDPHARQLIWKVAQSIKKSGKTLILTTHYMEEARDLCDHLIIMNKGKIIAEGDPRDLLRKHFSNARIEFPFSEDYFEKLSQHFSPSLDDGGNIVLHVENLDVTLRDLVSQNVDLKNISIHKPSLEDLFLHVTQENEAQ